MNKNIKKQNDKHKKYMKKKIKNIKKRKKLIFQRDINIIIMEDITKHKSKK